MGKKKAKKSPGTSLHEIAEKTLITEVEDGWKLPLDSAAYAGAEGAIPRSGRYPWGSGHMREDAEREPRAEAFGPRGGCKFSTNDVHLGGGGGINRLHGSDMFEKASQEPMFQPSWLKDRMEFGESQWEFVSDQEGLAGGHWEESRVATQEEPLDALSETLGWDPEGYKMPYEDRQRAIIEENKRVFDEEMRKGPYIIHEKPPIREPESYFRGVLIGLGSATAFWVAFAICLWLILR